MRKLFPVPWSRLNAELRRREVYPVIVAYAVVAWLLLQIGEVTFDPLGLPGWVMTTLIVGVTAGFPVAFLLAWVYDITPTGIRRDPGPPDKANADADRPSVAVLPFLDLSPAQDQEYFCEGIAEEILNSLTKIRQLRVAARSSSFRYTSEAGDVRKFGRELGVKAILEGSVRKSGDVIRVTAQLVNVSTGYHFWSKEFDRELKDIFAIQHEIASSITSSLLHTITPREAPEIRAPHNTDVNAYDFYLRGRQFFKRFRKVDIEHARQMFWKAIDLDPNFALAWSGYADCFSFLAMYADPKPAYITEAHTACKHALALAPDLAQAHASCGLASLVRRDFEDAEKKFKSALELNPNLFEAYYYYGRARFHQGDMETAAELFRKAAEIDPTDYQSRCLRVQILRGNGREREAMEEAQSAVAVVEKHLEWNPDDARGLHLGAGPLALLGQTERAKKWLRRALELDPDDPIVLYNVACNFATMNEVEESLDYLEQAIEYGTVSADWMRNDEDLVNLRASPRYAGLLEQVENSEQTRLGQE
jgi:TolB-like protein/Flp pilus assembly protein TadD